MWMPFGKRLLLYKSLTSAVEEGNEHTCVIFLYLLYVAVGPHRLGQVCQYMNDMIHNSIEYVKPLDGKHPCLTNQTF